MSRPSRISLQLLLVFVLTVIIPQRAWNPASMEGQGQGPQGQGQGRGGGGRGQGAPFTNEISTDPPVRIPLDIFQSRKGSRSRSGHRRRCCATRPTWTSIERAVSGWPRAFVTACTTPGSPKATRIIVLQDTDGDGTADRSHTFVQEPGLVAPLGVSVIDNKIIVAQPPDMIVYTDVDRNQRFDPAVDKREVLLTGFHGINHDHSLHSVTVGPDGKWVFNSGNTGAMFTDASGKTLRIFGAYRRRSGRSNKVPVGCGRSMPASPATTACLRRRIHGTDESRWDERGDHRPQLPQQLRAVGDVTRRRLSERQRRSARMPCRWVMEYANFGFSSNDGQRIWQADRRPGQTIAVAEWRQDDPGMAPAGDVYGGGSPTGNVFYENGALGADWEGTFFAADPGATKFSPTSPRGRAPASRSIARSRSPPTSSSGTPARTSSWAARQDHGTDHDPVPALGYRCRSRRGPSTSATGSISASAAIGSGPLDAWPIWMRNVHRRNSCTASTDGATL